MRKTGWGFVRVAATATLLSLGLVWILHGRTHYASTATITVMNTNDSGAGSLRQAIADAAAGDTINFSVTGTITLTSGALVIAKNLSIQGPGASQLSVQRSTASGTPNFGIFQVSGSKVTASISGLTISNGAAGGGILNDFSKLTLTGCTITGNSAFLAGGGVSNFNGTVTIVNCLVTGNSVSDINSRGGGLENSGTMIVTNSEVSGNSAQFGQGGGIQNRLQITLTGCTVSGNSSFLAGGGISNEGLLNVTDSTISGNMAISGGGGIDSESGTMTLINSTVTANTVSGDNRRGGGVRNNIGSTIKAGNTIIAGNTAPAGPDCLGTFMSLGYNLIGNSAGCSGFTQAGDQLDKNAQLGPLANNGGPTQTHALLCSSPAIDAGSNALANDANGNPLTTDQRGPGFPRVFNGTVDIGAFESELFTCPSNVVVSKARNQCGATVNYTPPTADPSCGAVNCSPGPGSFFPVGTTTVTCSAAGHTCSFTVGVVDTQPLQITCPANVTAVVNQAVCPPPGCMVVNFPTPAVCPGATITCTPASGSCFAVGTTSVTCVATDRSGNPASCSFSVSVFDVSLQDDSNPGNALLFNSKTGDYRYCCGGTVFTGRGKVSIQGCTVTLQHITTDRRVQASTDKGAFRGTASLQTPPGTIRCTITDRDIRNNSSVCQ